MVKELWNSFPRLIEQKINALLEEAEPHPMKAFHLYKACQRENLWNGSFEKFSQNLSAFFSIPMHDRSKSKMDTFLDRPLSSLLFEDFRLNFHNAIVNEASVGHIASWAHHLMRVSTKSECAVITTDVLHKAISLVTHPAATEKAENIEFSDFCAAWKKTVFKLFGKKHDHDLNKILGELEWFDSQLKSIKPVETHTPFIPTIYLTQTEIDWTTNVKEAVLNEQPLPKFPLSRGPQKQRLIDLERTINLYRIVQTTKLPDLIKHRENIRVTILDRCEGLLRECAR